MWANHAMVQVKFRAGAQMYRKDFSVNTVKIFRWANCALIIVVVILSTVFVRGLIARSGSFTFSPEARDPAVIVGTSEPDSVQSLSHYITVVGRKRLFKKGAQPAVDRSVERVHRLTVQQLASSLTLVGIVGGNELVAVIRDGKSKKTHSLKVGEYINELMIEEITRNSVILLYESETMELKL